MSDKLPPRILVIEPDEGISTAIANAVERYWFDVLKADNEEAAINTATNFIPNIIIISSRIKNISAVEMAAKLCKIRRLANIPIIFLIDQGENPANYNLGNPYIEILYRPFTPNQLMTIVKGLLRKSQPIFQDKIIKYKDISLDLATYKAYRAGKQIHLGPTEFKILQLFIQSPKVIFSREEIISHVWGNNKVIEPRTVDVHVNRLRNTMEGHEPMIKTIRSSGYCLSLPGEIDD